MYHSRIRITNGLVTIGVDALNGELLELIRESTGDNAIKNHIRETWSLLDGMLLEETGSRRFHVPRFEEIRQDESLQPVIRSDQQGEEAALYLQYPFLVSEGKRVDIGAEIIIHLHPEDCRAVFQLKLQNRTDAEIDDVAFPAIDGIWLGENYSDDVLIYPHFAGCRMDNPTVQLASCPKFITWKWQEYLYRFHMGQDTGTKDERGAYVRRLNYSGDASMLWMDLMDPSENTGIYITVRNEKHRMSALRMESFGEGNPGTGLAILHRPALNKGSWTSDECVVAFHEGDWHWAADEYRAWFMALPHVNNKLLHPSWYDESPGLIAHYDFQYQMGGIVHRFADIPALMARAMEMGFNHLLISGWNTDGFDYGFPHYTPNPSLGTPEELRNAVLQARNMGGHVSFYVNARLCNTGFEDQKHRIARSAVMQKDGSLWIEKYGAAAFSFASLCIGEQEWRKLLVDTVSYLTKTIGADSVYLDQFAMATSLKCYHPEHSEHAGDPCAWNQGYEHLLRELEETVPEEGIALLYEGCNDYFGQSVSGQLISELHCPFDARMPEVYKYTFPDQGLMDMMNPRHHSAMRPEHVARHSVELLHNAFTMGGYFWCYDLEEDNNWRENAEDTEALTQIAALRSAWLRRYGRGTFRDTSGILSKPDNSQVRLFEIQDGILLACASEKGLHGTVTVAWEEETADVRLMTLTCPEPKEATDWQTEKGRLTFRLPETTAAVIIIRIHRE